MDQMLREVSLFQGLSEVSTTLSDTDTDIDDPSAVCEDLDVGNDVIITGEDIPDVIITDLNTGDVIITGEDPGNVIQAAIATDDLIITEEDRSSSHR